MPGLRRRYQFDPKIKDLLVIAGLSGSGKSTFIKQLKRKRLHRDVTRLLPPDVHEWQHTFGQKSLKARLVRRRTAPRGQILHFDMTTSTAYRQSCVDPAVYANENASEPHPDEKWLNTILTSAEKIRIVIVKPAKEQLIRQLSGRAAVTDLPPPLRPFASRAANLVADAKRLALRSQKEKSPRVLGGRWADRAVARSRSFKNCDFYSREGAIDAVHAAWEASIHGKVASKLVAPTAYIEPAPGTFVRHKFRPIQTVADATREKSAAAGSSFRRLQDLADLLDNALSIPGTKLSVGVDAIIGVVPVIGDLVSGSIGGFIIWRARRLGAPRRLVARMIANTTADTLLGCIPIVGDIFDASYKSNVRNVAMLRRYLSGMSLMHGASMN